GSNAMGLFHPFLDEPSVAMIGVEAAGHGIETGLHAASLTGGTPGVLHGNRTYFLQDEDGQIRDAHSISAGLDYPGIGPEHAWLHDIGRIEYVAITDDEALEAFQLSSRLEGIIPAPPAPGGAGGEFPRSRAVGRTERRFPDLRAEGRAGLVAYLTAGHPDPDTPPRLFAGLAAAGADLIEIGMPFSDPMADGPAVQAAGQRALKAGTTLRSTLAMVTRLRERDPDTPYVLMGYYNPIYRYGADAFARDAVAAGVDGAIIVDLPPEEDAELAVPARAAGLDIVRLATPTSDEARLPAIVAHASGFL